MRHRRGIAGILALAAACLLVAGMAGYARFAVLDEGAFADRAVGTLGSDEVREEVGARIGHRMVSAQPELAAGEPMIETAVADAVTADPAFHAAFRDAAVRMHGALFGDADAPVEFVVEGSGSALHAELERRLEGTVPAMDDVPLFAFDAQGREATLRKAAPAAADLAGPVALALGLVGLLLLFLAFVWEPDRRRAAWGAGLAVAAAGGLAAAGVTAAADVVLDNFDTGFGDAVVTTVWDAYVGDLRLWALAVCAAGLVVAAAAGAPRPTVARLLAAPASRTGRTARAGGLLAVAALAVQIPELVLHTGLVAMAAGLFYVAAGDLMRAFAPPTCAARRVRAVAVAGALLALIVVVAVPV
ncbi:MAG TPA: hypothetical protein VNO82_12145 [Solirubrobacteraceae bacterium]|nr:hypothetical protein [Solirubrobacteraceae bacterium]